MKSSLRLGSMVEAHYRDRAKLYRILELGQLVRATTALIHELQKERGLSSGFSASFGAGFLPELTLQRPRTDVALSHALEAWEVQDQALTTPALVSTLASVRADLGLLAPLRQEIEALVLPTATVVHRYSQLVDRLIVVISEAPGTSPHPQVTLALISLLHLVLAKEFTGQERALGSAVCAQGHWEPFQAQQFAKIGHQRQEAFDVFARHATGEQIAAWEELKAGPTFRAFDDLRLRLEALTEGPGVPPEATAWFDRATAVVDSLRAFEKDLLDDLDQLCIHVLAEARSAWEDSREAPEQRESLVLRRLERTQRRLLSERQIQRRGQSEPPAENLVDGSSRAVEAVHRWNRDLDRLVQALATVEGLSQQAKILSLDASIEAIRRADVSAGAVELHRRLVAFAQELEETRKILAVSTDRASQALEALHSTVLSPSGTPRRTL